MSLHFISYIYLVGNFKALTQFIQIKLCSYLSKYICFILYVSQKQHICILTFYLQLKAIFHQFRIENLSNECEKQRKTREKGEHEMTELEQVVQKKANEVEELNTR